jgi:hypothetical protein
MVMLLFAKQAVPLPKEAGLKAHFEQTGEQISFFAGNGNRLTSADCRKFQRTRSREKNQVCAL